MARSTTHRVRQRGVWVATAGWLLFAAGVAGVLLDLAWELASFVAWGSLGLVTLGAVLVPLGAVLRAPPAPPFLGDLEDPWERNRPSEM